MRSGDADEMSASGRLRITTVDQSPWKIPDLIVCYLRAVERFRAEEVRHRQEVQLGGETHAMAGLSEALNWAHTIDDYLSDRGPEGEIGTERRKDWASAFDQEQEALVKGLRCARNRVHHQWWRAIAHRIGSKDGQQVEDWLWAPLPASAEPWPGEAQYGQALNGHRVLTTLDDLAAVFWVKRRWQITVDRVEQPGHDVGSPLRFDDEPEVENSARLAGYGVSVSDG